MGRLSLLEELEIMIKTEEIHLEESIENGLRQIQKIRETVEDNLHQEIMGDITAFDTTYYAPDYSDWLQFLAQSNGNEDYCRILVRDFSHEELEELWQQSHISEEMTEKEIAAELMMQIGQMKMLDQVDCLAVRKQGRGAEPDKKKQLAQRVQTRIIGLYNILYE